MKAKFTLVELLVVVAIISVLASLMLPALGKARLFAKSSVCIGNMRQCGTGLISYAGDYDGWAISGEGDAGAILASADMANMLIQFGYVKAAEKDSDLMNNYCYIRPDNCVFRCPSLPAPSISYSKVGHTLPTSDGWVTSHETFGLRRTMLNERYPGEILSTLNNYLPKYGSLYGAAPFMVDTVCYEGTSLAPNQTCVWYVDGGSWSNGGYTGLQLRHNRKGSCWFPDGHAIGLGPQDLNLIKRPSAGALSSASLVFVY